MIDIYNFVDDLPTDQKQIVVYLHQLLESYPGVTSKIRYRIPFYFKKSWLCYLNPIKKGDGVELAFTRANELANESGLLDFKDRKQVAGITLSSMEQLQSLEQEIHFLLQEALLLDETTKYSVKKS